MTAANRDRKRSEGEFIGALTAMLGGLIVALLIAVNVQLAGAGSNGSGGGGSSGWEAPTIPPPVQGTSNDILSEELQQLSTSLAQPVDLLREQLAPLGGFAAGQVALSSSFENVASSVGKLSSVRLQLRKMSRGLSTTTSTLGGLNRGIDATSRSTLGMEKTMRQVNRSIKATGKSTSESIAKMSTGIEAMQQSLGTMNQSLADTSSGTREMRESLMTLNANMERFLKLFCTILTSETECPAASE
jgi:uncharacterized phage infection (PIP) family protein YhgE